MTLPQEHFDRIERAAVSKPPRRVVNLRFVYRVIVVSHPLNFLAVAKNGASTTTSSIEREALRRFVRPKVYRLHPCRQCITISPASKIEPFNLVLSKACCSVAGTRECPRKHQIWSSLTPTSFPRMAEFASHPRYWRDLYGQVCYIADTTPTVGQRQVRTIIGVSPQVDLPQRASQIPTSSSSDQQALHPPPYTSHPARNSTVKKQRLSFFQILFVWHDLLRNIERALVSLTCRPHPVERVHR